MCRVPWLLIHANSLQWVILLFGFNQLKQLVCAGD